MNNTLILFWNNTLLDLQVNSRWYQVAQDDLLWERVAWSFFSVKDAAMCKVPDGDSFIDAIRRCAITSDVNSVYKKAKDSK